MYNPLKLWNTLSLVRELEHSKSSGTGGSIPLSLPVLVSKDLCYQMPHCLLLKQPVLAVHLWGRISVLPEILKLCCQRNMWWSQNFMKYCTCELTCQSLCHASLYISFIAVFIHACQQPLHCRQFLVTYLSVTVVLLVAYINSQEHTVSSMGYINSLRKYNDIILGCTILGQVLLYVE